MLKYKSPSRPRQKHGSIRLRGSKQKGSRGSSQPPLESSQTSIPLDKLLKNTPFITQSLAGDIVPPNIGQGQDIQIRTLPDYIIEDLHKRGLLQAYLGDPIVQNIIDKSKDRVATDPNKNIPEIVKNICLNTPINEINPNYEITDQKSNVVATCRDLNKYLSTKLISKSSVPKLPAEMQSKLDQLQPDEISMSDLPLSVVVEMCKYNDINLDGSAIDTLNHLLSDILKPRRRTPHDYKQLMKDIKKRSKQGKGILLNPKPDSKRKPHIDKSLLHQPQTFRNTFNSSNFLDGASLNLSKRFGPPDCHPSKIKKIQGFLPHRMKMNSPKHRKDHFVEGASSTMFESMCRFYPADSEIVSSVNITKGMNLNPNSFFRDPSVLYTSVNRAHLKAPSVYSPNGSRTYR